MNYNKQLMGNTAQESTAINCSFDNVKIPISVADGYDLWSSSYDNEVNPLIFLDERPNSLRNKALKILSKKFSDIKILFEFAKETLKPNGTFSLVDATEDFFYQGSTPHFHRSNIKYTVNYRIHLKEVIIQELYNSGFYNIEYENIRFDEKSISDITPFKKYSQIDCMYGFLAKSKPSSINIKR